MIIVSYVGDGTTVIPAPDPDPTVTPPAPVQIVTLPSPFPGAGSIAWVAAEGGVPVVELWVLLGFQGSGDAWFRWNNASLTVPQNQIVPFPTIQVPTDTKGAFLRIVSVNGATRVALGLSS